MEYEVYERQEQLKEDMKYYVLLFNSLTPDEVLSIAYSNELEQNMVSFICIYIMSRSIIETMMPTFFNNPLFNGDSHVG
jgi:hypothetical protein